jgi:hypothetical protein
MSRRPEKRHGIDRASRKPFIDVLDSYWEEYERWKTIGIVKPLVGVFELPEDRFTNATLEENLAFVGHGHCTPLRFKHDVKRYDQQDKSDIVGRGSASAVRDQFGRVRPIVFVRQQVKPRSEIQNEELRRQFEGAVRLLILMHELGHAEDICRGINFDYDAQTVSVVAAELYAHQFVCKHAKRFGYRIALGYYLDCFKDWLGSPDDGARLSAERAMKELDISGLRRFADELKTAGGLELALKLADRVDEARKL